MKPRGVILEDQILAELDKRLQGRVGTDLGEFLGALRTMCPDATDRERERAWNNIVFRQEVKIWRPGHGARKVIGRNPEFHSTR